MVLYNFLKILHILSAAGFLASAGYCCYLWHKNQIQSFSAMFPIPFALVQLITGFTMISLKHYTYTELWVKASVAGFILLIAAWFGFVYFSFSRDTRTIQFFLLSFCGITLLSMVFFMANKI